MNRYMNFWKKKARRLLLVVGLLCILYTDVNAQNVGETVRADDLTPELKIFLNAYTEMEYEWTLIGMNIKVQEQEKISPELNVINRVWHAPLTNSRHAFKIEFSRPYKIGSNILHLYLKADGDENTGRKTESYHRGVDYMFTLTDGDPSNSSTRLSVYEKDGKSYSGFCSAVVRGNSVYVAAEMDILQKESKSVFEYLISSYVYVRETPTSPLKVLGSSNLGYISAISKGVPEKTSTGLLTNPGMMLADGSLPGWQLSIKAKGSVVYQRDNKEKSLIVDGLFPFESIYQTVVLMPGHYLLRAHVRTNTFAAALYATTSFRIPLGVSDEYRWIDLPFYVTGTDNSQKKNVSVGITHIGYPPTRHKAILWIKEMELIRLGDTVLSERWVENMPAHPLHGLELINNNPNWERPGKVVFQDSLVGTELWLMTQEGKTDHSYVGSPDFSHEGKYFYTGSRRAPRGLLRTDGSARYLNNTWRDLVWLFPWEQKRLPPGTDPVNWICTRRTLNLIALRNIVTGETFQIDMPSRKGWKLIENPCRDSSRGPNIREITHNTLVWISDDRKFIGLSDTNGEKFRQFNIKSISTKPENDEVYPKDVTNGPDAYPMSSVWGKAWNNWRNAVDRQGNRYYLFEINRGKYFDDPENPYQVWAICLTEGDTRGLLRVIPNPKVSIVEHATSHTGGIPEPSFNWWELAAGLPRSGDNAIFLLEDGTLLHMSALGMHSSFNTTVSVNCPYTGRVDFIGNYPELDRITWPHEFRRDKDFAGVESYAEPVCPVVMIDLENKTLWTAAITNFYDYKIRYRTRTEKTAYHKPMFRTSPVFSPDFTKVSFFSPMLTGDHPDRLWADIYIAVVRYPQPPINLRVEGNRLVWDKPRYNREIEGYNLYHSQESGKNFVKVNRELIKETSTLLSSANEGFYVLTSVEYSGLESKMFSSEISVGTNRFFRHFYQAETGIIKGPMAPFFEPRGANNAYALAITDPEMIYSKKLQEGLVGSVKLDVPIPVSGNIKIMARVRGMSILERTTYTTGWPQTTDVCSGKFSVNVNGRPMGEIAVQGSEWKWVAMKQVLTRYPAGRMSIEFVTGDAGVAIDTIMITNDAGFTPGPCGNMPVTPPSAPVGLKIEEIVKNEKVPVISWKGYNIKAPYVKLVWETSSAPQGVSRYNIYRGKTKDFRVSQATLLASPNENFFIDPQIEKGEEYYYKVVAIDNWGNVSHPSEVLTVKIE